jgi:hypothetical protein
MSDMICTYLGLAAGVALAWFIERNLNIFTLIMAIGFVCTIAMGAIIGFFLEYPLLTYLKLFGSDWEYCGPLLGIAVSVWLMAREFFSSRGTSSPPTSA